MKLYFVRYRGTVLLSLSYLPRFRRSRFRTGNPRHTERPALSFSDAQPIMRNKRYLCSVPCHL